MSDANSTSKKKQTLGRRRIEMKKIEKKSSLQVSFTKRRTGLFKKASELALLCGAQIAILVQSPAGKIYSFGHPSVDALIHPPAGAPPPPQQIITGSGYEEAVRQLEREKRRLERTEGDLWWSEEYDGMKVEELEEYYEALMILADNVSKKAVDKEIDELMNVVHSDEEFMNLLQTDDEYMNN